jgi:predicted alpha/beta-fold hydrolase
VSLCNPFDLVIADEDFHKGFNNVYDRALAKALRNIFKKYSSVHLSSNLNYTALLQ